MCLRPIHITNNTTSFRPTDAVEFDAPCGECEECRNLRRREYEFRTFVEMVHNAEKGWINCFGTLTYKPECLPTSTVYPHYGEPLTIECFSRSDISKLFNKLRKHLYKKFGVKGIKYIVVTEYGDSTQRPHYHFQISVPPCVSAEYLHKWIQENWKLGFIMPRVYTGGYDKKGYYHNPFETPVTAIYKVAGYISKYCCKDMSFYCKEDVKRYVTFCKSYMKRKDIDEKTYNYIRHNLLYDRLTFVHTSRHFGEHICDMVHSIDDLFSGIQLPFKKVKLPIPNYNRRKLLFKTRSVAVDPSIKVNSFDNFGNVVTKYKVKYDLTAFGARYFSEYVRKSIQSVDDFFVNFIKNNYRSDEFIKYADNFGFDAYLRKLFENYHRDVSMYSIVFRNHCSPLHLQEFLDYPHVENSKFRVFPDCSYAHAGLSWCPLDSSFYFRGNEDIRYMRAVSESFYLSCMNYDRYVYDGIVRPKQLRGRNNIYFNSFPCFANFDLMIDCIYRFCNEFCKDSIKANFAFNLAKSSYRQQQIEFV